MLDHGIAFYGAHRIRAPAEPAIVVAAGLAVGRLASRWAATARRRRDVADVLGSARLVPWRPLLVAWSSAPGGRGRASPRRPARAVLVVDDGFLAGGRRSLELRAREDGRSVQWVPFDDALVPRSRPTSSGWLHDARAGQVVVAVGGQPACAATLAAAMGDRHVVAVVEPGTSGADQLAAAEVVDPARLVGAPDPDVRLACEWWEACDGDGRIAVRDDAGVLTEAGQERVARMVVAAL